MGLVPLFAAIAAMLSEYFYFFAVDQYLSHSAHLWSKDSSGQSDSASLVSRHSQP